jgi:hypothetical protein
VAGDALIDVNAYAVLVQGARDSERNGSKPHMPASTPKTPKTPAELLALRAPVFSAVSS